MRLVKLTMIETPGTKDNVIRPWAMDYKSRFVDEIANATEGGLRLTPHKLSRVAGGIMTPDTDRHLVAHIPGGWGDKRIMFAMVVELDTRERIAEYAYITGYTDHSDYTDIGTRIRFDKNMRLYFDSITRVRMMGSSFKGSRVWQPKIDSHDQILNRSAVVGEGRRGRGNDRPATLRPTDLFRRIESHSAFGGGLLRDSYDLNGDDNYCGTFTSQLRLSNIANNDSALYLSRGLDAYVKAAGNPTQAYIDEVDEGDAIRAATDTLDENIVDQDPYIDHLKQQTQILESGYITYGELMMMNPDFDEDRNLPFKPLKSRRHRGHDLSSVGWKGTDTETIAASIIAQSLPVIMIESMYSMVDNLILNSRARIGEPKMVVGKIFPFVEGLEIRSSFNYFEDMVENVLLNQLTKNGMFNIDARINANIDGDIDIWITVDDGEEAYFNFPAFAGSLTSPILTDNARSLDHLAKGVVDLSAAIANRAQNNGPSHVKGDRPGISLSADLGKALDDRDGYDASPTPRTARGRDW